MRKFTLTTALLAAGLSLLVVPAGEASPPTAGPTPARCGYRAASDPSPEAGEDDMVGSIECAAVWDRKFWLHGHLKVNVNSHAAPSSADVHCEAVGTDGPPPAWVAVCQGGIAYQSAEEDDDFLCMSVSWPNVTGTPPNPGDDAGWLYWHPTDDNGTPENPLDDTPGHWSPSPNKPCSAATQVSTGPIVRAIDDLIVTHVDPTICAVLKLVHLLLDPAHGGPGYPPGIYIDHEGDIFMDYNLDGTIDDSEWFWDCARYISYGPGPYDGDDDPIQDP